MNSIIIEGFLSPAADLAQRGADRCGLLKRKRKVYNSQLQQRQVRIAVIGAVLALLRHVVLEYGGGFGIVSVETVEDGFDAFGPVGGGVEGYAHGCW